MGAMQRLLPPSLVLILVVVSVVIGVTMPVLGPLHWVLRLLGVLPLAAGLWLNLGGAGLFARLETNIRTFDDPGQLVTTGHFRFTRNPMYLGFTLVLIAVAMFVGTLTAWVGPTVFFVAANGWYVPFEEQRMQATFRDAYEDYRRRVPRWIGPVRT